MTSFPSIRTPTPGDDWEIPDGVRGIIPTIKLKSRRGAFHVIHRIKRVSQKSFGALPTPVQNGLAKVYSVLGNFFAGLWEFMNPPLWAMLLAIIVASIPNLHRQFRHSLSDNQEVLPFLSFWSFWAPTLPAIPF